MGLFNRNKSSNAVKAMIAVQQLENWGVTEKLSKSQIVCLITSLPDAQKHLTERQYEFVKSVYGLYRKETTLYPMDMLRYVDTCKEIIAAYESSVPYFLFDGNFSEHLSEKDKEDIWFLYDEGMRFDEMEDLIFRGSVGKRANEIRNKNNLKEQSQTVTSFHVARNSDGTIQPVVAAPICPTNTDLIKSLLCTDNLGVDEVSHKDTDYYYFLYDKKSARPFPSVMILKFLQNNGIKTYVDMKQEDMKAVTYVIENYLN